MSGGVALTFHERYLGRGFVPRRSSWSRYRLGLRSFEDAGLFRGGLRVYRHVAAGDEELAAVHTPRYLARLREMDELGRGMVDDRQTPAYRGMFSRAAIAVGGSVLAARLVAEGRVRHAFNPGGGLHHAHADHASGFCLLNDVAVMARHLEERFGVTRMAILDVDAHHGDGTQALLSDRVLVVSLHEFGARFFPGTGPSEDRGAGLAVNLPLARGDGDAVVLERFARAEERIRRFAPELLVLLFGTDGHANDPFSHLTMSDAGFAAITSRAHALAHESCDGRLVVLGGGGYEPVTVARLWTSMLLELLSS